MRISNDGSAVGVGCDLCGRRIDAPIIYFSFDCFSAELGRYNGKIAIVPSDTIAFSFESCEQCYNAICQKVASNYEPKRNAVNCDLCKAEIADGPFCNIRIDKVMVDHDIANSIKCTKCGRNVNRSATTDPCECGSVSFIAVLGHKVSKNEFSMVSCQTDLDLITKLVATKRSDNGQNHKAAENG